MERLIAADNTETWINNFYPNLAKELAGRRLEGQGVVTILVVEISTFSDPAGIVPNHNWRIVLAQHFDAFLTALIGDNSEALTAARIYANKISWPSA
jgi:hypothetical protein